MATGGTGVGSGGMFWSGRRLVWGWAVLAVLAVASAPALAQQPAGASDWFSFQPPRDSFGADALDLRSLLNEPVAGSRGRVVAKGADLVFEKTGEKVRFWGAVAEPWTWPTEKADIDYMSRRLAKMGVNLVRLHIPRGDTTPDQFMDTVHYMTQAFKQQGIYVYLLWYCTACRGGYTNLIFFSPDAQKEYQGWARTVLATNNPYTNVPLAQDPAVAAVELLDEDSLFFWTFNPTRQDLTPNMPILEKRFGDWLTKKYGALDKAAAAWGAGKYPQGDDFTAGRVAMYNAGTLTGADWAQAQRNEKRACDQAQFMAETMRDWYAGTKKWMHDELGYDGLVVGSNWKTADERVLGPLDEYANLACDVTARNTYFNGPCNGPNSSYRIENNQFYQDLTLLKNPEQAILMHIQLTGHPHIMTEGGWAMPNRFRTEGPFLVAGYFSLQGIDGYCDFRLQKDWLGKEEKWPIQTPAGLGQYPAAALVFRKGYVKEGPIAVNDAIKTADAFALKGAATSQPLGLDAVQAARVPEGAQAEVDALPAADPLAFYVGGVVRTIADAPGKSSFTNTAKLIDRNAKVVRSATGELALDYGKGVATMNAPCAQGATGFLQAAGKVDLKDVTIDSGNEYGTVMAVSLDGKPLTESEKILVQVMTEEKNTGWQTEPAKTAFAKDGPEVDSLKLVNVGAAPILVRKMAGTVSFKRADAAALKVRALDFQGNPREEVAGGAAALKLLPDCLYYIVAK